MIKGVHLLLNSRDAEADRAFFRDVLNFPNVDAGHGWLIFALPPSEMAIHPSEASHSETEAGPGLAAGTVYLMCDRLQETLDTLAAKGVEHADIVEARWGVTTSVGLPGGGNLGLYEPHHALAI